VLECDGGNDTKFLTKWRWFPDGTTNMCYNCVDRHVVAGRGDQPAIAYDSPLTGTKQSITYRQLLKEVSRLATVLGEDLNVAKGDRVVIYMPMIPQALVAMLACARIGAVHSVVFGGFASKELATRITDCDPKVVISASAGIEPNSRIVPYKPLLDESLRIAQHNVHNTIIVQRPDVQECELKPKFDLDYHELMSARSSDDQLEAVPLPSNHPHYILYTSGTTGVPKGIVRDTGGYATALQYTMRAFYDTDPGDAFFAASDIGWVVGHSYAVYGPLLNGSTTILYEGKPVGTPDPGAFWRIVEEYRVKTLFAAPTAFRAIKQADPNGDFASKYDLSSLNALFVAGEHCDPDTLAYCQKVLKEYGDVQYAIDHWWQTELGHPGVGNAIGLGRMPLKPGGCSAAAPGFDVRVVDEETGVELPTNELGDMVIRTPLAPGTLTTLYNNDEGFVDTYLSRYPGYYDTGDAAYIDDDGYVHIMGRTDDLINTAGHRLSTGGLEEVLQTHPLVADCAVIPVKDKVKGQIPIGFVMVSHAADADEGFDEERLKSELVQAVRDQVGPIANFRRVAIVKALPKTRSGKILRYVSVAETGNIDFVFKCVCNLTRPFPNVFFPLHAVICRGTMSKIADGEPWTITPTVDDPDVFMYLEPEIRKLVEQGQ